MLTNNKNTHENELGKLLKYDLRREVNRIR